MIFSCPGSQKFKNPQPETIICNSCGGEVEIWTDESTAVCPTCKERVTREMGQSCFAWCKYARECAGERVYNDYIQNKKFK